MNREYFRSYFKEYYIKRKLEYITLLGGKCARCGSTEDLEFDHIDPSLKEFNITQFLEHSKKKILLELEKCQLLCKKCHLKKTFKPRQHGTTRMYRVGCRCSDCSKANTECVRNWRIGRMAIAAVLKTDDR